MISVLKKGMTVYLPGTYRGNGICYNDKGDRAWQTQAVVKGTLTDFYCDGDEDCEKMDVRKISKKKRRMLTLVVKYDRAIVGAVSHVGLDRETVFGPENIYKTEKAAAVALGRTLVMFGREISENYINLYRHYKLGKR